MYRSSSWNRVSDEHNNLISSSSSPIPSGNKNTLSGLMRMPSVTSSSSHVDGDQQLPIYDETISEMTKKERAQAKFAENAVHFIPLVLILCAIVLWLLSTTPGITSVESRRIVEGLSVEGEIDDNGSDGKQNTGLIPNVNLGGIDSPRRTHDHKASRKKD